MSKDHKLKLSESKGKAIKIEGITYRSIRHAAEELKITRYTLIKQLGLSSTEPW